MILYIIKSRGGIIFWTYPITQILCLEFIDSPIGFTLALKNLLLESHCDYQLNPLKQHPMGDLL